METLPRIEYSALISSMNKIADSFSKSGRDGSCHVSSIFGIVGNGFFELVGICAADVPRAEDQTRSGMQFGVKI